VQNTVRRAAGTILADEVDAIELHRGEKVIERVLQKSRKWDRRSSGHRRGYIPGAFQGDDVIRPGQPRELIAPSMDWRRRP